MNTKQVAPELLERYQAEIDSANLNASMSEFARKQESFDGQEDKSMAREQLDLTEEITRIDYLIKGYSLEPSADGGLVWTAPTDKDMIIFSDYGIHLIRNTICWYLNKNTLLSNFDEATIRKKMWDFTNDLIDTIFMEYDKVFATPSVEECIDVLKERIRKKATISAYALEIAGRKYDLSNLIKSKFDELENNIEEELEKIRLSIIKGKLKRYMLTIRVIQDAVHSTYLRAWRGQERATLRQHVSITENRGMHPQATQQNGGIWPWQRR